MQSSRLSANVMTHNQAKRPNTQNTQNAQNIQNQSSGVSCNCNMPATSLVVRKDGPNFGRPFFGCGNNRQCNFFQWGDEVNFSILTPFRNLSFLQKIVLNFLKKIMKDFEFENFLSGNSLIQM